MVDTLNNNSSYDELFNVLIESNNNKIEKIKTEMNKHIIDLGYEIRYNELQPYLDYTLNLLTSSFPLIKKYHQKIIPILSLVNRYNIHPSIIQSLYANILFSIYIIEISLNKDIITDANNLDSINNIYNEIELMMSIFNDIFINIDIEYKLADDKLCYNSISSFSHVDFTDLIENINNDIFKDNILDNNLLKLNTLLVNIEHLVQVEMNEYLINLEQINNDEIFNNKLEKDLLLFEILKAEYNKYFTDNYKYMVRYENYKNILNLDIMKFEEKNCIYYWIDHIAFNNGIILDKLLKNIKE